MTSRLSENDPRVVRLRASAQTELAALSDAYRDRLVRIVDLRLDARVRARLDPADVVQDAFVDAAKRVDDYVRNPKVAPFLWLRLIVGERLAALHRHHLGAKMRDAGREVSLYHESMPLASTAALASMLLGRLTSPSQAALRAERLVKVQEALNCLEPIDREILALRHFEQLSRGEAAHLLGISEEASAKRYIRALTRIKAILAKLPGGLEGL
jgi:RNA polymerase sigma-70 factor (ECF subfamily)